MTVLELIEELNKIEDKEIPVCVRNCDGYGVADEVNVCKDFVTIDS